MSTLTLIPYYIERLQLSLEIRLYESFNYVLLYKNCFGSSRLFAFLCKFFKSTYFYQKKKKSPPEFWVDYTEFLDQYGKN